MGVRKKIEENEEECSSDAAINNILYITLHTVKATIWNFHNP